MRPSFYPRLINGPFDDPGLFIPFFFDKLAIIFDLGDIHTLSTRDLLKVGYVFISHTHMDHFIGFDYLLRLLIGREKDLYIFGPEGFIKNVEGRLSGYSWNLVEDYTNRFVIHVTEVYPEHLVTKRYSCQKKFSPLGKAVQLPFKKILLSESAFSITATILNHKIPCLGFAIKEQFHINIKKDSLNELGLEVGPWIKSFKMELYDQKEPDSIFNINSGKENRLKKKFVLGDLAKEIAIITPGQKVSYITDCAFDNNNFEKIVELIKDSDHLFIEAAFLEKDKDIAQLKNHLTAWQAGMIAGSAKVKQFTLFHFSPRYIGKKELIIKEAKESYLKFI